MITIKTLTLKLLFIFKSNDNKLNIIIADILKSIKYNNGVSSYQYYKNNFKSLFNAETNSIILEKSLLQKNKDLAHYLLNHEDLIYPYKKENKKTILDSLITNNLYHKNHLGWLLLISLYDGISILFKETDNLNNIDLAKKLINHKSYKQFFINCNIENEIKELGISYNLLNSLLLNIKIPSNNKESKLIKI